MGRACYWAACDGCVDNLGGDDIHGRNSHRGGRLDTVSPCPGRRDVRACGSAGRGSRG